MWYQVSSINSHRRWRPDPFSSHARSLSPPHRYDIQITLCIFPITISLMSSVCKNNCHISTSTVAAINNNLICYQLGGTFCHAPLDVREHSAVSGVQNTRCEGSLARRKRNSSPLVSGITYCSYGPPAPHLPDETRIVVQYCVVCRSQWPRGLRRRSVAARLLRLWVRIPPGACLSWVLCVVK